MRSVMSTYLLKGPQPKQFKWGLRLLHGRFLTFLPLSKVLQRDRRRMWAIFLCAAVSANERGRSIGRVCYKHCVSLGKPGDALVKCGDYTIDKARRAYSRHKILELRFQPTDRISPFFGNSDCSEHLPSFLTPRSAPSWEPCPIKCELLNPPTLR